MLNKGDLDRGLIVAEGFDYEIVEKMYAPHDNPVSYTHLLFFNDIIVFKKLFAHNFLCHNRFLISYAKSSEIGRKTIQKIIV